MILRSIKAYTSQFQGENFSKKNDNSYVILSKTTFSDRTKKAAPVESYYFRNLPVLIPSAHFNFRV